MNFFIIFLILAHASSPLLNARRRLQMNPCVDEKVVQVLSDTGHPNTANDLILEVSLKPGSKSEQRCRERGLKVCEDLGSNIAETSLYCNDLDFSYIGTDEIDENSVYACFRYVYSVKSGEQESVDRIASAAESEDVVVVSELDKRIGLKSCQSQESAPWGLGFLDRHQTSYTGAFTFQYQTLDGEGTVAYVVDTGIDPNHVDFEDRIIGGENLVNPWSSYMDLDGHGTHVAATIMGKKYGIAKRAKVYAFNVFGDGEYTNSRLIITAIQRSYQRASANGEKAVINLSIGGPANSAEDNAANAAVANGVTVVVASGNSGTDACDESPGRAEHAITVGATGQYGFWSRYSNHGPCVDIIAPGTDVTSARANTRNGQVTLTGTSMAAPHVAGVALQIMSRYDVSSPSAVKDYMLGKSALYSMRNVVSNVPSNTLNVVLQSPCISQGPIDECVQLPGVCQNDGTCIDLVDGFSCDCPEGASGDFCETRNECDDWLCENGGTCVELPVGFECTCRTGYTGSNCEMYTHPPEGCTCITATHPTWGEIGNHCKGWGGNPQPFCYISPSGDCDGVQWSRAILGAKWVECISEEQTSTHPELPDTPSPTFTPTTIPSHEPSSSTVKTPTLEPTDLPTTTLFPTRNPTLVPTFHPTFQPSNTPTKCPTTNPVFVNSCDHNECTSGKICIARDDGYDCACPADRYGDDCESQWVSPSGCSCVSVIHPHWGQIDSCTTRTNFHAWCYVEGDCAKTASQTLPGNDWADCVESSPETTLQMPTTESPTTFPTASIPTMQPTTTIPTMPPTTVSPTTIPTETIFPTTTTTEPDSSVQVYVCQYFSMWWRRRCCWKGIGLHDRSSLTSGQCPANNELRFIHVPQGVRAILFDGERFEGEQHVVNEGNHHVSPNWVSSMIVMAV